MPRNRQPTGLLIAKGRSHMGKAEIEERQARELHVPFTDVHPPEYMTEKQKQEFTRIADMLLALNVFTELDEDCLARYVLEHELYLAQHTAVRKARRSGDSAQLKEAEIMYDKTVRRIRGLASDLGLTPTSRCKLSIPPPPVEDDEL